MFQLVLYGRVVLGFNFQIIKNSFSALFIVKTEFKSKKIQSLRELLYFKSSK